MYKTLSGPVIVQVELTTGCNQCCIQCYNYWRQGNQDEVFTLSRKALEHIAGELIRLQVFRVVISGGEPLLQADRAFYFAKVLSDAGICVALNTNLNPVKPDRVKKLESSGVYSVLTSLMSYDELTHDYMAQREGSHRRTLRGIKILLEAGVRLGVNMVVTKVNKEHVYDTGLLVASLGVKAFSATKAAPPANAEVDFSELFLSREEVRSALNDLMRVHQDTGLAVDALEHYPYCLIGDVGKWPQLANRRCSAGVTACTIGANGEVRPCSHAPMAYGNIFTDGLQSAWQKMQPWRDGSLIPVKCWECRYLAQCSGGCRIEALVINGALNAMDPHASGPNDVLTLPEKEGEGELGPEWMTTKVRASRLMRREEPFGAVVAGKMGRDAITFINPQTDVFLRLIAERPPRSIQELQEAYGLDEESLTFLQRLIRRGVLEIV